jgi:hypothetical protein
MGGWFNSRSNGLAGIAQPGRSGGAETVIYPGHLTDLPWLFARRVAFGQMLKPAV